MGQFVIVAFLAVTESAALSCIYASTRGIRGAVGCMNSEDKHAFVFNRRSQEQVQRYSDEQRRMSPQVRR